VVSLEEALRIGTEEGLRYIYAGNIPGHPTESTVCPSCGEIVIERQGFRLVRNGITKGGCPRCGTEIPVQEQEVPE
jgi:pyruvate formate lyase activating enzyme